MVIHGIPRVIDKNTSTIYVARRSQNVNIIFFELVILIFNCIIFKIISNKKNFKGLKLISLVKNSLICNIQITSKFLFEIIFNPFLRNVLILEHLIPLIEIKIISMGVSISE